MNYDKNFLLELDKQKNKIIYARITALTFDEKPIEFIEGRVTQGSINVDGVSAVRRSCSLTMIAKDFDYRDYYWGLNTKFKLEIGVENLINSNYPEIIWFKQGIYVFTSFNTSRNTNNFTISLQGKDKMCLLNGEVGGSLESSIDFGTMERETEEGIWQITKIPIYQIIRNAVHVYGGEPYHNIIINDLDTQALELLEYRYDIPMYLYRECNSTIFTNATLNGKTPCEIIDDKGNATSATLNDLTAEQLDVLIDTLMGTSNPAIIRIEGKDYYVAKVEYGQTAGYRMTDLTFAGDLICNVGESITSVLDKIKNMLSEFEYFYDLDGQFIFQKKQSFVNTLWTPLKEGETQINENWEGSIEEDILFYSDSYVESMKLASSVAYTFNEGELITAFNNNPNMLNMKNDYSVWGTRKTAAGAEIPVHLRYAIDTKPTYYKTFPRLDGYEEKQYDNDSFNNRKETVYIKNDKNEYEAYPPESGVLFHEDKIYYIEKYTQFEFTIDDYDWREIIYQMAKDYYKHNTEDDFELDLRANNLAYYPTGRTGYERYYTDIQGFWRQLYNPEASQNKNGVSAKIENCKVEIDNITNGKDGATENKDKGLIYVQNLIRIKDEELTALKNELAKIEDKESDEHEAKEKEISDKELELSKTEKTGLRYIENELLNEKAEKEKELLLLENEYDDLEGFYPDTADDNRKYWHMDVFEAPHNLNFWFDFLDTEGALSQFNVKTNGARSKAINDNAVKSIYFRETPNVIFIEPNDSPDLSQSGYKYIQVNDMENMFTISAQGKSAKDKLDELIYQHGYCVENATITTIPIYYLQPNTRIHISDQETNLDGDYIISKMTIPLAYNGTMSITATKAAENIM